MSVKTELVRRSPTPEVGQLEDLAGLVAQLLFLVRLVRAVGAIDPPTG